MPGPKEQPTLTLGAQAEDTEDGLFQEPTSPQPKVHLK